MSSRRIRVAISGTRGIPGFYGGFETVATELGPRLARRGFDITVYCRPRFSLPHRPVEFEGVRLVYLPSLAHRALESPSAEFLSSLHCLKESVDILYVLGFRASAAYFPHRWRGTKVVFNTDGFDWQRSKWGPVAKRYLRVSERIGVMCATGGLIADSRAVADYFMRIYGRRAVYLTYGAPLLTDPSSAIVQSYGLRLGAYYLVVARLEPENNVKIIIDQYLDANTDLPLVVVGGQNYETAYTADIRKLKSDRVRLLGGVYSAGHLDALYQGCFAYIHGHEVGGTNPSLLRAMGAGALVLVNDVIYNREVVEEAGMYWTPTSNDLPHLMRKAERRPELIAELRALARQRIENLYNWELIANEYANFFRSIVA